MISNYRMKELALKQQRASQEVEEKPTESQTPPRSPVQDHPPVPTTQPDTTAEPTPRAETPLERTLLEFLSDKDLGATEFVTASELSAVLASLPDDRVVHDKVCVRVTECACVCVCDVYSCAHFGLS